MIVIDFKICKYNTYTYNLLNYKYRYRINTWRMTEENNYSTGKQLLSLSVLNHLNIRLI